MKLSIKPNLIDSLLLLQNRKQKMPRTLIEPKEDLKPMLRELKLKIEREKLRREKEELKRQPNKLKSRLESKSKESQLKKPRKS